MSRKDSLESDLGRMRELLYALLAADKHGPEPIVEMLRILDRLAEPLRGGTAPQPTDAGPTPAPRFRRNKEKKYKLVRRGGASFLAEERKGSRQPYLVPQEVYDALAAQLSETTEPTHFEILMEGVARRLGRTQPDYLLRTCIRFWMVADPPLVEKVRTRYRAIRPSKMIEDAGENWHRLVCKNKSK